MSLNGISTVARLEIIQRVRGARWYLALGAWLFVVAGVTGLSWLGLRGSRTDSAGATIYDVILFFVLGLSMLVMPALTSSSVNGDREHGVLATLQTTLLSPADIILGKLLGAWLIAMAFLASALPFLVYGYVRGGVDPLGALRSLLVICVVLAVICAVGLMFSTLTARPVGSAALTYLTIAGLCALTVIVFGMSAVALNRPQHVEVYGYPSLEQAQATELPAGTACETFTATRAIPRTDRTWWILALNPFVVVADAAPQGSGDLTQGFTPLRYISVGVRSAKAGPVEPVNECWSDTAPALTSQTAPASGPVWPYGLLFLTLVGAASTAVAIRRTRTPVRRLPSGTRIA